MSGEGRRPWEAVRGVAVISRPAGQVPEGDWRAHGGRLGRAVVMWESVGTGQQWRHLAESALNKTQTIPKWYLILIITFLP